MNRLVFKSKKPCAGFRNLISAVSAASLMLSGISVAAVGEGASVEAYMDYAGECISVSYTSDVPYVTDVMFYLIGEDDEFESLQKSLRTGSAKLIPGEAVTCSVFAGGDIPDGRYRLYAIPGGYASEEHAVYSPSFRYMDSSARDAALKAVNDASADNAAQVVTDSLGDVFEFEETEAYEWKGEYIHSIKKEDFGGSFSGISDVYDAWKLADALVKVNSLSGAELAEAIEENKSLLGADTANEYYSRYTDEAIRIITYMAGKSAIMSKTAFGSAFAEAGVVAAVNKSDASGLDAVFTKNSGVLGIDAYMDRYAELSKSAFARQFDGFRADSADEVKEKFMSVLSRLEASGSSSGGSSGGGGGGSRGSGGGGNISVAPGAVQEVVPVKKTFADTENHWAAEYISALSEMRIINGYTDGTFRPEELISREEFAKVIVSAYDLKYDGDGDMQFADIPGTHWAHSCVATAAGLGIVKGVGEGMFGAGRNISRQDAAVMLHRASALKGYELSAKEGYINFADNDSIADYAAESVAQLSKAGVINGFSDGTFAPEKSLTRAEAAKIIFAMLKAQ